MQSVDMSDLQKAGLQLMPIQDVITHESLMQIHAEWLIKNRRIGKNNYGGKYYVCQIVGWPSDNMVNVCFNEKYLLKDKALCKLFFTFKQPQLILL